MLSAAKTVTVTSGGLKAVAVLASASLIAQSIGRIRVVPLGACVMVDVNVRKGSTAMADSNTQFRFILAFVPFPLFFRFGGSDGQDTGSHSYTSLQDTGSYSTKWKKVAFGDSRHGPGRHTMLSKVQGLLRSGSSVHWAVVYRGFSRKRPGAGRRGHVHNIANFSPTTGKRFGAFTASPAPSRTASKTRRARNAG